MSAAGAAAALVAANSVLIVPGYGLAVAKAQYPLKEMVEVLTANGKSLAPKFGEMLSLAHVTRPEDQARFHILGCDEYTTKYLATHTFE